MEIDFGRIRAHIVGIDLGTTNSLVAFMDLTGPRIIPGADGDKLVPSVVSVDAERRSGRRQSGARAADHAARAHGLFGEAPDGPRAASDVQEELKLFPFRIAAGSESVIQLQLGDRTLHAAGDFGAWCCAS